MSNALTIVATGVGTLNPSSPAERSEGKGIQERTVTVGEDAIGGAAALQTLDPRPLAALGRG